MITGADIDAVGAPWLLDYLLAKFREDRKRSPGHQHTYTGSPPPDMLEPFIAFSRSFLTENYAAGTFALDHSVGVTLANNDQVAVCPVPDVAGTMQEAHAIEITSGRSQRHQQGVSSQYGLDI